MTITENPYNKTKRQHQRIIEIHENDINPRKLNSTAFERHLMRINKGSKRRLRNNHKARLAKFKATIKAKTR